MRFIAALICMFTSVAAFAHHPDVAELRALYYKAPAGKAAADKFLRVMDNVKPETDPLIRCYKGMALMLKANYSMNPYYKWAYFNKGKALVDEAVDLDPVNVEIRFMRFCAQTNAPSILGYNEEIAADKKTILRSWHSLSDDDLKEKIKKYLIQSGYCSKDEKSVLL